MNSTPDENELRAKILAQAGVPGFDHTFVIGYKAPQVTVYSQQLRALNLVWALFRGELPRKEAEIVIVGGGISGVTATAAAMLYGARVTLLEQHDELLHLQRGCHTRYLHPRIFEWPAGSARRAGAELPILNWSVGTASDVAARILADYHRIRLRMGTINEITNVRGVRISSDGKTISWDHANSSTPDAIILALGFGIERTVPGLPRRSYWRVDSLSQTPLDSTDDNYVVLVAGTGDGGIIDVLRAKLKEFDHGGFLDECVLRLEAGNIPGNMQRIEFELGRQIDRLRERGKDQQEIDYILSEWLDTEYKKVSELEVLDSLLKVQRSRTVVIWTGRLPCPASPLSQALNRVLGWRLWFKGHVRYVQGGLSNVGLLDQTNERGYRYGCTMVQHGAEREPRPLMGAHQVVVRYGSHSPFKHSFPDIHKALQGPPRAGIERDLDPIVHASYTALYQQVHQSDALWREDIKISAAPEYSRSPDGNGKRAVWRIRLWLDYTWALGHVDWVDYDLHPEYGAVHRRAVWTKESEEAKQKFRHWINTWDDFWIRARCSDGGEFGFWLSDAIENSEMDAYGQEANPCAVALRNACVRDLRTAAEASRPDYRLQPWSNYVDPPSDANRGAP